MVMQSNQGAAMASTKLTVRGHTIRTQSHFRYQIVALFSGEYAEKVGKSIVIVGRSDSPASAAKRAGDYEQRDGRVMVVVDRVTGEELISFPKQATPVQEEEVVIGSPHQDDDPDSEDEFIEPEDTTGRTIDTAALFLVDLTYPNMFELRGTSDGRRLDPYCKVCGDIVERNRQEAHHAGHKRDRSHLISDQIRSRKEESSMAASKKTTPADQGVPAAYLNEDGSKFRPGMDARLKSDLIAAIDDLDRSKALHTFDATEAAKILAARGWNDWLLKSRKGREAKAAREAAAAEAKKAKVKDEVAAKRAAKAASEATGEGEVKPDPKPARKPRSSRSRKVGA